MDRRERYPSLNEMMIAAMTGWQSNIWTALPGIVSSFDAAKQTCEVQLAIQIKKTSPVDGSFEWITIRPIVDCPVFFPSGGGCTLTFPLVAGDECLVIFSSRCIDAWWQSGGVQNQPILRMHDISDGFVFAGVRSQPRKFNVSTSSAQLRTDDGNAYIEINPTSHDVNVQTSGNVNISCVNAVVNSTNSAVNATGIATIKSPSIILKNAGTLLKKLVNDTFLTLFDNHTHTTTLAGYPTSTPNQTSTSSNATSVVQAE